MANFKDSYTFHKTVQAKVDSGAHETTFTYRFHLGTKTLSEHEAVCVVDEYDDDNECWRTREYVYTGSDEATVLEYAQTSILQILLEKASP
jgi:hypothetical protein